MLFLAEIQGNREAERQDENEESQPDKQMNEARNTQRGATGKWRLIRILNGRAVSSSKTPIFVNIFTA